MSAHSQGLVDVKLLGSHLQITAPSAPELFRAPHRVFFTNTLSFTCDDDTRVYTDIDESSPAGLAEVVQYLKDAGFGVALDHSSQQIYDIAQSDRVALRTARVRGADLKDHPELSISIPGLKRPYKSYQAPAVSHLINLAHAANFSVPGSGKTAIVLMAFAALQKDHVVDKLVVIGPSSSFVPWEEEAKVTLSKHLKPLRILGSKVTRKRIYRQADKALLILLTYQMASNDLDDLMRILHKHRVMLVLDESHNIKRLEGGKWAESVIGIAPLATKRVILSGTPMPNSVLDLWSQFEFLWPNNSPLGDRAQFKYRTETDGEPALDQTRRILFPFYWRIKKDQLGLPRPRYYRISLKMSKYQQAIYDVIGARVLSEVIKAPTERARLRVWRRARMIRLLQAASNPALLTQYSTEFKLPPMDASGLPIDAVIDKYSEFEVPEKINALSKLVRKLVGSGKQVLVWTAFIHNILTIERTLKDLDPAKIYGDVPRDESEDEEINRERIIRDFKRGRYRVLIANPSACAESVSLHQVCKDAIYMDRTFNAAHYLQSLDRIHRVGLKKNDRIRYYILQSKGSVDEAIEERLEIKLARMKRVLNDDLAPLDLDSPASDFNEESEEDADFAAVIESLRRSSANESGTTP